MHKQITSEQHQTDYFLIRQYEFQQLPPGKSLLRLLYAVGVPILLRQEIKNLLSYGIDKNIILFPSVRDVSDVYFTAYFDPEYLHSSHKWWGHSFGTKSVDTLMRVFRKSKYTFGTTIDTPLPMPDLFSNYRQRENEFAMPSQADATSSHLIQLPAKPVSPNLSATASIISSAQYKKAIARHRAYEKQRRGKGRSLLVLLKKSGAHARVYNGVLEILRDHIKAQLIPFTYSGDVTDVFFVFYFTSEELLKIRNFGLTALNELQQIMAQNGLLFK